MQQLRLSPHSTQPAAWRQLAGITCGCLRQAYYKVASAGASDVAPPPLVCDHAMALYRRMEVVQETPGGSRIGPSTTNQWLAGPAPVPWCATLMVLRSEGAGWMQMQVGFWCAQPSPRPRPKAVACLLSYMNILGILWWMQGFAGLCCECSAHHRNEQAVKQAVTAAGEECADGKRMCASSWAAWSTTGASQGLLVGLRCPPDDVAGWWHRATPGQPGHEYAVTGPMCFGGSHRRYLC